MTLDSMSKLVFFVNGVCVEETQPDPEWTLLYYLRNKLRLCGTKLGCGEGGCGACTVMLSRYDSTEKRIINFAVNACLTPVCAVHGMAITTVEGLGSTKTRLHAVQERLAKAHGSQCGFCTPGFVMSMYALLRSNPSPSMQDIEESFQGNLCRCTGYRPILEGYKSFIKSNTQGQCCGGMVNGKCCMSLNGNSNGSSPLDDAELHTEVRHGIVGEINFAPYDPSQEPIFPPALQVSTHLDEEFLVFKSQRVTWYRPVTLEQLLELKVQHPYAKIVVGNTEIGLEMKFRHFDYPVLIQPVKISELQTIVRTAKGLKIGGAVTITSLGEVLSQEIATKPETETRVFQAIKEMLQWFAGKQIRNAAAIAGNIMTGSPISDLNPLFMAAGCELELQSVDGVRTVIMDDKFYTSYRKNIVLPHEILLSISIPYTTSSEYFAGSKQARRREDDIAIANAGLRVVFRQDSAIVEDISLAFGGMAPTTVMARQTMSALVGRTWNQSLLEDACQLLLQDLPLSPSAPGGMIPYRQSLCLSFFFKFYLSVSNVLYQQGILSDPIPAEYESAIKKEGHHVPRSTQVYELVPEDQKDIDPIGKPVPHTSAFKQTTGEAVYVDDMPRFENELYAALVLSTRPNAKIVSVDPSAALKLEGVHAFISAADVPGTNSCGAVIHDEYVFAADQVTCTGQVIGCVIAGDLITAQRGARQVKVVYEDLSPVILTIQDAITHDSFFDAFTKSINQGDVETALREADHVIEGQFHMSGQEHFYLETNVTIAVPKGEDGEMELFCSTQNPTEIQLEVARVLGVPANRIVCRVKRLGGGFGGKETRAGLVAFPTAVAAHKLNRPVRCVLERDEDMTISGTRHPFLGLYKVGFTHEGRITALQVQLYSNAGNTLDLSSAVMERAMFHIENAYKIPNLNVIGRVCKTNLPSNTAFRGFGGPQGMLVCEHIISSVAAKLNVSPEDIRIKNFYKEGDTTHYNQRLEYCTLSRCWEECVQTSGFEARKSQVAQFNKQNRWKKRGLAIVPTKFGIAFTLPMLNQAGALVMIYKDGSVLLSHGGTEMGQGLHTKMIQIASRVLGISDSKIHIAETGTDKVPNTSPTAASASSDLNGMAVLNACQTIMDRLKPIKASNPGATWEQIILKAYVERISLSATGFYRTPGIGYDFATNSGNAFNYYTYGVACSEIEIDCLTGDHRVLRTDIVMDLGESLNPAIDIGQIEGGFVQGLGLYTLEEPMFTPTGALVTKGPSNYKLPGVTDIPLEFNVSLLRGAPNPRAIFSSKAVGEPPLFLASSVFFAIKAAVQAAREEMKLKGDFQFNSPATAERIRMACVDQLTSTVSIPEPGTYKPWSIVV